MPCLAQGIHASPSSTPETWVAGTKRVSLLPGHDGTDIK
jgi:hypothetical protein